MAEPLKNSFGADVPRTIARMIAAVSPRFNEQAFVRSALDGYNDLELMPRAWKIGAFTACSAQMSAPCGREGEASGRAHPR